MEQLKDVYSHFMLYYKNDIPAMWEAKRKKSQSAEGEDDGEAKVTPQKQKMPAKRDLYTICRQAGKRHCVSKHTTRMRSCNKLVLSHLKVLVVWPESLA